MKKLILRVILITAIATLTALLSCGDGAASGPDSGASELINHYGQRQYTLTTSAIPAMGGHVSRSPEMARYPSGTEVTVTATAEAGYVFTGWSGASAATTPSAVITMRGDLTLVANFLPVAEGNYTLMIDKSPAEGGTVSRDPEQPVYPHGTVVTIKATPEAGYMFIGWTGTATTSAEPEVSITMNSNITITANFLPISNTYYTLMIDRNITDGGSVSRFPNMTSYPAGSIVTVTATPNPGYSFAGWSGALGSEDSVETVTMNTNLTLTANFRLNSYMLTTAITPAEGGKVLVNNRESSLPTSHNHGVSVDISASVNPGYRFVNWTVTSGQAQFDNANNTITTVILSSNATINANFQQLCVLTINRNPTAGGTATPESGLIHDADTPIEITATSASGYRFYNWTVTNGQAEFTDTNSALTTVTFGSDATISANFQKTCVLTINQTPATVGGSTTPTSGLAHDAATPISITATLPSGYWFNNWRVTSGVATFGNANNANTTVTLSSNATIVASFMVIPNPGDAGWFTDSRDGKNYRTVKIGNQTWMAENLNYSASGSVCYNNQESNCNTYGRLYNWETVMNGASSSTLSPSGVQGVCPVGWHVPSNAEWTMLTDAVGGLSTAGTKLKSNTEWHGTDDYVFSALPGGRHYIGSFLSVGTYGTWWSATEYNAMSAYYRIMSTGDDGVGEFDSSKADLYSLRCLRD